MRGNVTGTTNHLHPSTRQELFHCGNGTCCVLFHFSKGDFPTNGGVCILAYVEVNICPEGRGKTALAWSGLRALQLPAGELLPGCSMWPWTSHTASPSCFPSSGRAWAVLGAVWGAAEVLGARRSLPVHPLSAGQCAQRWEQCAWRWGEASPQPILSQFGAKSPGWSRMGCQLWNSETGSLFRGP